MSGELALTAVLYASGIGWVVCLLRAPNVHAARGVFAGFVLGIIWTFCLLALAELQAAP